MLSYQHGYHAGNMADVHKHAMLSWMLAYMTSKPKPLTYLETHAGRGLYDLTAPEAVKTGEAAAGITQTDGWFAPDHPYMTALNKIRAEHGPNAYPGSPLLAATLLRSTDPIYLTELHPQEFAGLKTVMKPHSAVTQQRDGWEMALSRCPPDPRRGILLVDPSYEIKAEYQTIPTTLRRISRKWPVGVIVLWYPILTDTPHRPMIRSLSEAIPDSVVHEVSFPPARPGHRMIGSGLFVVNPPYGFSAESERLSARFNAL